MKAKSRSRSGCTVRAARWASYAVAGAATVAAANDAEAAILYSGVLNTPVNAGVPVWMNTLIANSDPGPKNVGGFLHAYNSANRGAARFVVNAHTQVHGTVGPVSAHGRVAGFVASANAIHSKFTYASNLALGAAIPGALGFNGTGKENYLASTFSAGSSLRDAKFRNKGIGFLAFEFKLGAGGEQYGWARVNMTTGISKNGYTVVDYAYGTPGQAIKVGQTVAPEPATLGLLALGAVGLLAARAAANTRIVRP